MRRTIKLRHGEYEILAEGVIATSGGEAESRRVLSPIAAANLLRSSTRDRLVARSLRLALTDYMGGHGSHHRSDRDVFDEFARLLTAGRVALRPVKMRTSPVAWSEPEPKAESEESAPPPPTEELAWLEIVLVDEDDMPVVGEKCEVVGPDGARVGTYTTDSEGTIMLDQIEAGTYSVSFNKLDQDAWEAA